MTNKQRRRWARLFKRCKTLSYFETRFQKCEKLRFLAEEFCNFWNSFMDDCGYPSYIKGCCDMHLRIDPASMKEILTKMDK